MGSEEKDETPHTRTIEMLSINHLEFCIGM